VSFKDTEGHPQLTSVSWAALVIALLSDAAAPLGSPSLFGFYFLPTVAAPQIVRLSKGKKRFQDVSARSL
jgi:hypothetical protein